MASLMYGAGLRLMECTKLRVHDLDVAANQIIVRDGKGFKDRLTMLPETVKGPLRDHLALMRQIHQRDLADGYGRASMPYALARKYPFDIRLPPISWKPGTIFAPFRSSLGTKMSRPP